MAYISYYIKCQIMTNYAYDINQFGRPWCLKDRLDISNHPIQCCLKIVYKLKKLEKHVDILSSSYKFSKSFIFSAQLKDHFSLSKQPRIEKIVE